MQGIARMVDGGWKGALKEDGRTLSWRCPHLHPTRREAADCAMSDWLSFDERLDIRDAEIDERYMRGEITAEEAQALLMKPVAETHPYEPSKK